MTDRIEGVELRRERVVVWEVMLGFGGGVEMPKKRWVEERRGKASSKARLGSRLIIRTASTNITNAVSPLGIDNLGLESGRGSGTCSMWYPRSEAFGQE